MSNQLSINTIKKGIVLDHIKPGLGIYIYNYLKLNEADFTVALITNAMSNIMGRKDILKIENNIDLDLKALGFIDPGLTVNIIDNEVVIEKVNLELPESIEGVLECKNPRCITAEERDIVHRFKKIDKDGKYACQYCDTIVIGPGELKVGELI